MFALSSKFNIQSSFLKTFIRLLSFQNRISDETFLRCSCQHCLTSVPSSGTRRQLLGVETKKTERQNRHDAIVLPILPLDFPRLARLTTRRLPRILCCSMLFKKKTKLSRTIKQLLNSTVFAFLRDSNLEY